MQEAMVVTCARPVTGRETKAVEYAVEVADHVARDGAALQSLA